jgi:hypothetical protein
MTAAARPCLRARAVFECNSLSASQHACIQHVAQVYLMQRLVQVADLSMPDQMVEAFGGREQGYGMISILALQALSPSSNPSIDCPAQHLATGAGAAQRTCRFAGQTTGHSDGAELSDTGQAIRPIRDRSPAKLCCILERRFIDQHVYVRHKAPRRGLFIFNDETAPLQEDRLDILQNAGSC